MNNTKTVRIAQLAAFLRSCLFYLPIISLYFIDSGATISTLILAQIIYSVVTLLFEIPTGYIADTFGNKRAMVLGYAFGALAIASGIVLTGKLSAIVFYILFAIGDSFISGSEQAYLYKFSKGTDQYKKNYGTLIGLQSLGLAVSTGIVSLLLLLKTDVSHTGLLVASFVAYALATLLSFIATNDKRGNVVKTSFSNIMRVANSEIQTNTVVRSLFLLGVLTVSGEYFLYSVYQPYYVSNGVSEFMLAAMLCAGAVLNFFVTKHFYKLEKHFNFETIVLGYSLAIVALFMAMAVWQSKVILVLVFIALRGLFNALSPVVSDYLQSATKESIHATLLSAASFTSSIASIAVRLVLLGVVSLLSISYGLAAYSVYLLVGTLVAVNYLKRCGCVGKVTHTEHTFK